MFLDLVPDKRILQSILQTANFSLLTGEEQCVFQNYQEKELQTNNKTQLRSL